MKPLRLMAGVLGSACLLGVPAAACAYCVGWDKSLPNYDPLYYSARHEFRRSKYVIEAQVTRETWLDESGRPKPLEPPFENGEKKPWGFDPYLGAYYDLRVLKSFKGKAPAALRVFSENSTARFWFDVGSRHVLFVSENTFDPPIGGSLTVDTCGNSKALPEAVRLLSELHHIASAPRR